MVEESYTSRESGYIPIRRPESLNISGFSVNSEEIPLQESPLKNMERQESQDVRPELAYGTPEYKTLQQNHSKKIGAYFEEWERPEVFLGYGVIEIGTLTEELGMEAITNIIDVSDLHATRENFDSRAKLVLDNLNLAYEKQFGPNATLVKKNTLVSLGGDILELYYDIATIEQVMDFISKLSSQFGGVIWTLGNHEYPDMPFFEPLVKGGLPENFKFSSGYEVELQNGQVLVFAHGEQQHELKFGQSGDDRLTKTFGKYPSLTRRYIQVSEWLAVNLPENIKRRINFPTNLGYGIFKRSLGKTNKVAAAFLHHTHEPELNVNGRTAVINPGAVDDHRFGAAIVALPKDGKKRLKIELITKGFVQSTISHNEGRNQKPPAGALPGLVPIEA